MNKHRQKNIEVYAHWAGLAEPTLVGILHAAALRGKEIFSFEYHDEWLASDYAQAIDPALIEHPQEKEFILHLQ